MNARIRKELRSQAPALACAIVCLAAPFLWSGEIMTIWFVASHIVACSLVAASSIGQDLHHGTFQTEMALPISRVRRWHERCAATSAGLALVTAAYAGVLFWADQRHDTVFLHFEALAAAGVLIPMLAGPSGTLIALLLGEIRAAIIITVLANAAIAFMAAFKTGVLEPPGSLTELATIYCLTAICAAYCGQRSFLNWQDHNPLTQNFTGLTLSRRKPDAHTPTRRPSACPRRAIVLQEFRLQQINLIAYAAITITSGIFVAVDRPDDWASVAWCIIWPFPVFLGLASVSEERRLGMHSHRLTLPLAPAQQWLFKFLTNLAIGIGTGLAVILILVRFKFSIGGGNPLPAIPLFIAAAFAGVLLGMTASALTTSYLTAIGSAMLILSSWAFGSFLLPRWFPVYNQTPADKLFQIVWTLTCLAGHGIAGYRAFRDDEPIAVRCWRMIRSGGIGLAAAFAISAILYFRTWELLEPGPTHSRQPENVRHEQALTERLSGFIVTPEGELHGFLNPWGTPINPLESPARIADGSDWKQVTGFRTAFFFALKTNGTLWYRGHPQQRDGRHWAFQFPAKLTRYGTASNWSSVDSHLGRFAGIQTDGSLWQWGNTGNGKFGFLSDNTNRLESLKTPQQIDTGTIWKSVLLTATKSLAISDDGRIWEWGNTNYIAFLRERDDPKRRRYVIPQPVPIGRFAQLRAEHFVKPQSIALSDGRILELRIDTPPSDWIVHPEAHDWLDVVGTGAATFFLHHDGSVWKQSGLVRSSAYPPPPSHRRPPILPWIERPILLPRFRLQRIGNLPAPTSKGPVEPW